LFALEFKGKKCNYWSLFGDFFGSFVCTVFSGGVELTKRELCNEIRDSLLRQGDVDMVITIGLEISLFFTYNPIKKIS
jgi:hypothetical protein